MTYRGHLMSRVSLLALVRGSRPLTLAEFSGAMQSAFFGLRLDTLKRK